MLITVRKTQTLPVLQATGKARAGMKGWAESQGFAHIDEIADDSGPVEPKQIKDTINRILDRAAYDQLIVYFSGHGVNIGQSEYWLLTAAPRDSQAAVNVDGSEALARRCSIPHVVFISDACRTAAPTIQAQSIRGSEIFPNEKFSGSYKSIDIFRACGLGDPAYEVPDVDAAVKGYTALYTDVLLDALHGGPAELLDRESVGRLTVGYVRPRPLKTYLRDAVGRELARRLGAVPFSQEPDATVTSDETAWLSRLSLEEPPPSGPADVPPPPAPPSLLSVSQTALHAALEQEIRVETTVRPSARELVLGPFVAAGEAVAQAGLVTESISQGLEPFGPAHFETRCGFKVRGTTIRDAFARDAAVKRVTDVLLRIEGLNAPAANVLLVTKSGAGTVVPAIQDFLASLTFDGNQLVSVAYEPADTSSRWQEFRRRADELRALRSLIASSARFGVFRLEGGDVLALARQMQIEKGVDPAMALYAAYAYDDINRQDRLREMEGYLHGDLGFQFFDVALLADRIDGRQVRSMDGVYPFIPMLAQGWALLSAHEIRFSQALESLHRFLLPSLWTLFDPAGVEVLQVAMRSGDIG